MKNILKKDSINLILQYLFCPVVWRIFSRCLSHFSGIAASFRDRIWPHMAAYYTTFRSLLQSCCTAVPWLFRCGIEIVSRAYSILPLCIISFRDVSKHVPKRAFHLKQVFLWRKFCLFLRRKFSRSSPSYLQNFVLCINYTIYFLAYNIIFVNYTQYPSTAWYIPIYHKC